MAILRVCLTVRILVPEITATITGEIIEVATGLIMAGVIIGITAIRTTVISKKDIDRLNLQIKTLMTDWHQGFLLGL
jgi:hypothetical protein